MVLPSCRWLNSVSARVFLPEKHSAPLAKPGRAWKHGCGRGLHGLRYSLSMLLRVLFVATYQQIQDWVKARHGFVPKTCWIAHCKELAELPVRAAPNRGGKRRAVPCPPAKREPIIAAFRHFGMI